MSKETLKQAAEKLFASTAHKELWANSKGEFFTSENIGRLSLKGDEVLTHFKRNAEELEETKNDTVKPKSADVLIEEAKSIETIDLAEIAKEVEAKGKNRVTVINAYDERIKELTAQISVVTEGTNPPKGTTPTDNKNS